VHPNKFSQKTWVFLGYDFSISNVSDDLKPPSAYSTKKIFDLMTLGKDNKNFLIKIRSEKKVA
jgi:hypothetical protein